MRRLRRLSALTAAGATLLAGLSGCGLTGGFGAEGSQGAPADTEGTYLIFPHDLTYQVQLSRLLNPSDVEDASYLKGLPAGTPPLAPDESWFAVFIRVSNETKQPHAAASNFQMIDAQGTRYLPVGLTSQVNAFAYQPSTLAPKDVVPASSSAPADNTIQGSELLFRVKRAFFFNRPVIFQVTTPSQATKSVDVDV